MDINDILIDEDSTLLNAMELLNDAAKKVLLVVREGRFKAVVTDGDIRRWILRKGNLDGRVKDIANYNPKFLYEKDKLSAMKIMKEHFIEALPILNNSGDLVSIVFWNDEEIKSQKNFKAPVVIMAGGLGTRLYPYTKILPKPLIPIGEIPIVEHIINRFHSYGSKDFYLIVNHKKNMIKAYFNEIGKDYIVTYVDEEVPLGTGGGLSLLKGQINSTFILTNCDILIEEDYEKIYEYHKKENNLITMVCSIKKIKIPYGIVEMNENGEIENMKEKPEFSFFTNTGLYVVEADVIENMESHKAIGFPEIIESYRHAGEKIGVYPIGESSWLDMGQFDEMEEMKRRLRTD